jgi:hypothetical protein
MVQPKSLKEIVASADQIVVGQCVERKMGLQNGRIVTQYKIKPDEFWKGERPLDANAPQLEGAGEMRLETTDRATGYWTTRPDHDTGSNARTAGVYRRADPADLQVLDGGSEEERAELIARRLREWKSAANTF